MSAPRVGVGGGGGAPLRRAPPPRLAGTVTRRVTPRLGLQGPRRPSAAAAPSLSAPRCRFLCGGGLPAGAVLVVAAARRRGRLVVAAALAAGAAGAPAAAEAALLATRLDPHADLHVARLPNGLRVVILPNRAPPDRFEAHLEVHAGSVDEGPDEQGLAHLVEHVTFLGSRRREGLLGTGARSNAYTDFHHTVFHVHAPSGGGPGGGPMLPAVLDALAEIAFEPELAGARIEKERRAVVAEAQMMNTIEYRVDCQLLAYLHWENALGCRFPIGKMEQVAAWSREAIAAFWARHYFPANATLYLVGDVDAAEARALVEASFGRIPAAPAAAAPGAAALDAEVVARAVAAAEAAAAAVAAGGDGAPGAAAAAAAAERAAPGPPRGELLGAAWRGGGGSLARPPVEHQWGVAGPALAHGGFRPAAVSVFRHRLLQLFQLSVFCKVPVRPMTTLADLRRAFMVRVLMSVLQFRVNARYVEASPPFVAIELDHSDSGREGCAVSTLTVTSEPGDWRGAVRAAVQEVRRLQRHGVTAAELDRYRAALLRDSEQLAEQSESVPSADNLEFVMESLALGHTVLDQRAAHRYLADAAATVTPAEVGALARSLLSFASHYRAEGELLREWEAAPGEWAEPGPTVATAIVACLPAFVDASGHSTSAGGPVARGASLATTQHVEGDGALPPPLAAAGALGAGAGAGDEDEDNEPPEGAVRFECSAEDIAEALGEAGLETDAHAEVDVPTALIPDAEADALVERLRPHWVPLDGLGGAGPAEPPADPDTGVVRRRLSNGVCVNYRRTANEPRAAMVRVTAAGGRAREPRGAPGAVAVGARALSEAGTVGGWSRAQVELFCVSKLVNCVLEADEEWLAMDFHYAVGDGGAAAVLQLLHLFLAAPRWEEAAAERARQMYASHHRALPKSLERATADRIMAAMCGPDRRFRDPTPDEVAALDLATMRDAVMAQLHAGNLEVSVVGDFDAEELEAALLRYVGTVEPREDGPGGEPADAPVAVCRPATLAERHQAWHLRDSDERACAYIAGAAPNRWGNWTAQQQAAAGGAAPAAAAAAGAAGAAAAAAVPPPPPPPGPADPPAARAAAAAARRAHPLYASVTLALLTEVMNSRLFTTVRDSLGLTYDVSFDLSLFDRLPGGWFHVAVTSTPARIREAAAASLRVLRSPAEGQPFTARELARARRTLLTRHESDGKDNAYWLGLLTHLQSPAVPAKGVECVRDLRAAYEAAQVEDLRDAYAQFDFSDGAVFSCVGTSGRAPPKESAALLQAGEGGGAGAGAGGADAAPPAQLDPDAFMDAFKQFVQSMGPPPK